MVTTLLASQVKSNLVSNCQVSELKEVSGVLNINDDADTPGGLAWIDLAASSKLFQKFWTVGDNMIACKHKSWRTSAFPELRVLKP